MSDGAPNLTALMRRVRALFPGAESDESDPYLLHIYGLEGVMVCFCPGGSLQLSLPYIDWGGRPHDPELRHRLWRTVPAAHDLPDEEIRMHLMAAITARRRQYRRCHYCGERNPPGHMHCSDCCQGCAQRHLRVVY